MLTINKLHELLCNTASAGFIPFMYERNKDNPIFPLKVNLKFQHDSQSTFHGIYINDLFAFQVKNKIVAIHLVIKDTNIIKSLIEKEIGKNTLQTGSGIGEDEVEMSFFS